ncbi:MAG: sugar phosphate nucleotidyltransferase [Lachnospiraceae bacterium]|nr:sugar phosphate nucleotidyltransferase [Lachnospiraceae bacterium]
MKKTTLIIMAAGIGSRFGQGIKQLTPVGPGGEIIMDYSIHDALEAGFNKIVFIIRKDLEKDFKEIIGNRIEKITEVAYAFQELSNLPEGFEVPEGRTKPWGTGQAVLSCKGIVNEPFAVINADDYYGKEGFVAIHKYLTDGHAVTQGKMDICMAGFILGNTLSDNGAVTRGICQVDDQGNLVGVDETSNIVKTADGAGIEEDGQVRPVDAGSHVSMNMWGMQPEFMDVLDGGFKDFLSNVKPGDIKAEYLLPMVVDQLIKADKASVAVLESRDKWFGVTYHEDRQTVVDAFQKLVDDGVYKAKLFD